MNSLADAIGAFRADPAHRRWYTAEDVGGCWPASRAFACVLHRLRIPYSFRRYRALPGWRTTEQHVVEVDGLIVDWIARQFRPGCEWPDVRSVEAFEAEFGEPLACCPSCGTSGGPLDMATLERRPLSEHRCRGPEAHWLETT